MHEGPTHVKDCWEYDVVGYLHIRALLEGWVYEDSEEGWKHNDSPNDIPWSSTSNPGLTLVAAKPDYRRCEPISNLARKHGEACIGRPQLNYLLEVVEHVGKPSSGTQIVAQMADCISAHMDGLQGIPLDLGVCSFG